MTNTCELQGRQVIKYPDCATGQASSPKPVDALLCSEMLVQWTTRDRGNPVAFWRAKGDNNSSNSSASSDTYRREDLCGGVANSTGFIHPGWFHTATLSGLQPSTEYLYSYGDEVCCLSLDPSQLSYLTLRD